jgi:hypothetical protein
MNFAAKPVGATRAAPGFDVGGIKQFLDTGVTFAADKILFA